MFPDLVFCGVEGLQVSMPSSEADPSCQVLQRIFEYLSPGLRILSIIFTADSAVGINFMAILRHLASSLGQVKILKLRYNYCEEDNEVSSIVIKNLYYLIQTTRRVI